MGNTAVAALHYDMTSEIERADKRMARAMRDMPGSEKPQDFYFGKVISWGHASSYQVCVIHGNTGWRIGFECEAPEDVLESVAAALRHHGWKCTPPKRPTHLTDNTGGSEQ